MPSNEFLMFPQMRSTKLLIQWGKIIGDRYSCKVGKYESSNDALYGVFGVQRILDDPSISKSMIPQLDKELLDNFEKLLVYQSAILRRNPAFYDNIVCKGNFFKMNGMKPAINSLTIAYTQGMVKHMKLLMEQTIHEMPIPMALTELSVQSLYCRWGRVYAFVANMDELVNLPVNTKMGDILGHRRFVEYTDGITLVNGSSYSRILHKNLLGNNILIVL